ncbi:hypothetical protein HMPREF1141_0652 [Clostridium sp. MSTE9]|nr:hypothetical protein HMPREF1141_0652 [Clostridium sp. MSTE9]
MFQLDEISINDWTKAFSACIVYSNITLRCPKMEDFSSFPCSQRRRKSLLKCY